MPDEKPDPRKYIMDDPTYKSWSRQKQSMIPEIESVVASGVEGD